MTILHDTPELIITVQADNIKSFYDVLKTIEDIQKEYRGEESDRQKQQRLMQDMEQQIAELLSKDELE